MRPGEVRIPWLNEGVPTLVPDLTMGEQLELMQVEVSIMRKAGMVDDLPKWEREKIDDIVSTAYVSEYLYARLRKADASLSRAKFDQTISTKPMLFELSRIIANADREAWPLFRRAALGPKAGGGTGGWLRKLLQQRGWTQ